MSHCGNNNKLALQHRGFRVTWSLAAKGLLFSRACPSHRQVKYWWDIALSLMFRPLVVPSAIIRLESGQSTTEGRKRCVNPCHKQVISTSNLTRTLGLDTWTPVKWKPRRLEYYDRERAVTWRGINLSLVVWNCGYLFRARTQSKESCEVGREGWQGRFISDCNGIDAFNRWFSPYVIAFKLVHRTNEKKLVWESDSIIRDCVVHQHDRLITWLKTTYSGSCLRVVVVCRISVGNGRKEGWLSGKTVAVDKMAILRNLNEIFHLNYLWMPSESPCFASFELQFSTSVYSSLLSQCLSSLTQTFFLCFKLL